MCTTQKLPSSLAPDTGGTVARAVYCFCTRDLGLPRTFLYLFSLTGWNSSLGYTECRILSTKY